MGERKTPWKGRCNGVVWHVYRPSHPCRFGLDRADTVTGRKFTFSLRSVIGWVIW